MPEGEGTVLDNTCPIHLSNMFSSSRHDNTKLPIVTLGGFGGAPQTGRVLDYSNQSDESRKLCSLYLSPMDRVGMELPRFGDADARLAGCDRCGPCAQNCAGPVRSISSAKQFRRDHPQVIRQPERVS